MCVCARLCSQSKDSAQKSSIVWKLSSSGVGSFERAQNSICEENFVLRSLLTERDIHVLWLKPRLLLVFTLPSHLQFSIHLTRCARAFNGQKKVERKSSRSRKQQLHSQIHTKCTTSGWVEIDDKNTITFYTFFHFVRLLFSPVADASILFRFDVDWMQSF